MLGQGDGHACVALSSRQLVEVEAPAPGRGVGEIMMIGACGPKERTQCESAGGQDQGEERLQWTRTETKQYLRRVSGAF